MRTYIDRGGTFTDVVRVDDAGRVTLHKVRSDVAIIGDLAVGHTRFGTTVATNALLERRGVRTLALLSDGLESLPWLGDMRRPALFDPDTHPPAPLCLEAVGVKGRLDSNGIEIEPLQLPNPSILDGFDAVAIALMHSPQNPAHEASLARWVRQHRPHLFVALGHNISPEQGYLDRLQTTLVHAAITPFLQTALERDRVPADALAIRSDGSLCEAHQLFAPDAVLSGPAGGVLAVAQIARGAGFERAVGLDMGGTSTDVCRIDGELPRTQGTVEVAGIPLRRPMLAVHTIAAGGGSICTSDGEQLAVGPRSAGAHPGPQCYGRGGPPTLTDAALVAGLLNPDSFEPPLDPHAVDLPAPAEDFLALARETMAAAVRQLAHHDGADLRDHALVAFGGAAGQHAAGVAERLGIRTVLIHPAASVLSAWGQSLARREHTQVRVVNCAVQDTARIEQAIAELSRALPELEEQEATCTLHHEGTEGVLDLPHQPDLEAAFHEAHRVRFGYQGSTPVRVRSVRVRVREAAPEPTTVGSFPLDTPQVGPTVLHTPTTSVWIPEGWRGFVENGMLRLEHTHPAPVRDADTRTPLGVALWGSRFMAVARAGGTTLRRTARSLNIRERLDFSCAVFDSRGLLVANAPHIPVHLGAMGVTVRDLIQRKAPPSGTHWLCNDPEAGGSHLPDLTVVSVRDFDGILLYVASRAHHVDVGGITPGSMPPHSTTLEEEGAVFTHVRLNLDGSGADLVACRDPQTVQLDLAAQIAANRTMFVSLGNLASGARLQTWMRHLIETTESRVRRRLASLKLDPRPCVDSLQGVPLSLQLRREGDALVADFSGSGPPHTGNLNAPMAVVRAAVLYAVRVLLDERVPLNEGALAPLEIVVPERSILGSEPGRAVAGGNVETSQRIADLFLRAAGRSAASAGTMNNLTLGGRGWSYYETLGGGQGGSARGPGLSGRQLHMTNTAATDPEALEARLPLRVRQFSLRVGTGGAGDHPGGEGLVRELEVLEACEASLLCSRRTDGATGLRGKPGQVGVDSLFRKGRWEHWDGQTTSLEPGDRVRVLTPGGGGFSKPGPARVPESTQ